MNNLIQEVEKEQFIKRPQIRPGDVVAVHQEIEEGGKKRTQIFKGVVIKIQGRGSTKTFTVRRISFGIGIERTYPLYSPLIKKITISKSTKVRRAKLYYLREKTGKAAKLKEKAVADDVIKFLEEQERAEKEIGKQKTDNSKQEKQEKSKKEEAPKEEVKEEKSEEEDKEQRADNKEQKEETDTEKAGQKAETDKEVKNPENK